MRHFLAELRRGLAADVPILLGLVAVWATFVALLASRGINGIDTESYALNLELYLAAFFVVLIIAVGWTLARHRPERPIGFLATTFISGGLANRLIRGVPMLAALVIFLPIFSKMKAAIPLFNAYSWDSTWIEFDRTLHGNDPWQILQPLLGYPLITSTLAVCYHLWILLLYVGAIYFCFFHQDRTLRARFFIAYFACWTLLGVVAATMLASVGPCFVGVLLGNHHFDSQMAYLRNANDVFPIMVLHVQEGLASSFREASNGLGSGISAMPSMHVSIATLMFLATRKISRPIGVFFGVFLVVIMIGSVHLAYHYAVDGYVSFLATSLIWLASGALARRIGSIGERNLDEATLNTPVPSIAGANAPGMRA